jgi:sugar/nucleoside kinase (ribokinase family)
MAAPTLDVVGIGNAIVDVLVQVDDAFLACQGLNKGTMALIDAGQAEALYAKMVAGRECSGGSVANSIAGIASLGGKGAYIGKLGGDSLGATFACDLKSLGVQFGTKPMQGGPATARCLILVTPDAQRTMNTFSRRLRRARPRGHRRERHRRRAGHLSRGLPLRPAARDGRLSQGGGARA